ncbi:hypothetical protein [Acinetobacter sp.]|uniref:hypothetical protein n=1 Tax=Acinetobacter sp. TaxID=472 RepID=UPI003890C403
MSMRQAETGIKTVYYIEGKKPKIIHSKNANRAVQLCVAHMQINHYGSRFAEVWDAETGELHASIKRSIHGNLTIHLARDARKYETKYAIGYLLGVDVRQN